MEIALSETWLIDENIHFLQKLHRHLDLVSWCNIHGRGGGIGMYVGENYVVERLTQKTKTLSEFITIEVKTDNGPLFCINHMHQWKE